MTATAKDVAQAAKVALPTAYEALRGDGRLSDDTRKRVLDAARRLDYRPTSAARAIRTRRNRRIGVVVKHHPVVMEMLMGINAVAQKQQMQVTVFPYDDRNAAEIAEQAFAERAFDGMMAVDLVCEELETLLAREPHCVWVNTNRWAATDHVRRDEAQAGRLVGNAAAVKGWRKWIFVCGRLSNGMDPHFSTEARLTGIRERAEAHGAELQVVRCPHAVVTTWRDLDEAIGPIDRDTAIIFNDTYRVRTMQNVLLNRGLMPGRDVAVACCDDTDEFNLTWPELSRVRFDRIQLGQVGAEMLLERIDADRPCESVVVPCRCSVGETLMRRPF